MGSPPTLTRQDEKRLKILAAAEETFLEKGFHAASMSDIARKAGISTPHLYNFYENKAAIALSVQEKMAEETFTLLTASSRGKNFVKFSWKRIVGSWIIRSRPTV